MADQRRLQPMGILKDQFIKVATLTFKVNLVVLKIQFDENTCPMLLGRPWFKTAKLKQDWGSNTILIRQGKVKIRIPMLKEIQMQPSQRPLWAQTINLAAKIEDLEEEEFLEANPSIVPVFEINVMAVLGLSSEGNSEVQTKVSLGEVLTKAQVSKL